MPGRALTLALLIAISIPIHPGRSAASDAVEPVVQAVPAPAAAPADTDSLGAALQSARVAYQAAWAQRQVGDYEQAVHTATNALLPVEAVLAGDLDASRHRDFIEVRGRLAGIRDAARHDLEHARDASGDDGSSDPKVLNAPAAEDLRLQFNADVHRYIEFFTGAGRSTFERWLRRSGRYMRLFQEVLTREGLPPDLAHLVFVESGFNVNARSVSAAVGPWQFLRSTGRLWGLTVNNWVDERRDPEKSTVAAARYLKHLYSIFGDWPLALASYNAGEGTILRAIKSQGTTNYWDLRLPRQTEDYVPQFMAVMAIAREPEKYGFSDVDFEDPMGFDQVALKGTVDLHAVARLAECSYEELRDLNPAVRGSAAPARDGVTTLRVPEGKAEVILSKLGGGESLPAANLTVKHRVRRGETIQGIANQYRVDATQLARANHVDRAHPLRRGMVLSIHAHSSSRVVPADLEAGDPRASTRYVPTRDIRLPATLAGASDPAGRVTHTVRRGETLASIAQQYGATVEDVKKWNHLKTSVVRRGTRLKIRTGDAVTPDPATVAADSATVASLVPPPPRKHAGRHASGAGLAVKGVVIVQQGDTLSSIAMRHGTTVAKLKRANGLPSSVIRTGQKLRIPA